MSVEDRTGAWIAPSAIVPETARVFPGAWIGPNVVLGPRTVVGPGAVLGYGEGDAVAQVGDATRIDPGVHIEPGVEIGPECRIGSGTIVRAGARLGRNVNVGSQCTLMENCRIAECAVLYHDVYVCEHAELRPHCQLLPRVILLNQPYPATSLNIVGPVIGECSIICVNAVIWPGVMIGYHAMIAASSEVKENVADYMLARGSPAVPVCDVRTIRTKVNDQWVFPYPWMRHLIPGEDLTQPALPPKKRGTTCSPPP